MDLQHWMASNHSMSRPPHVSKAVIGKPAAAPETTATVRSSNPVKKPPRELRRLPPISGGGARADRRRNNGATATAGTELAERAAKAWMRHALAKRVAMRMLKRSTAPPPPPPPAADEMSSLEKVIACCCARLPPGLRCALHQDGAPGRCWIRAQRGGCSGGGGGGECGEAVAPPKAHGWAFSEYARWHRHVWMPSRFYLEWSASRPRSTVQRQSGFVM